MTQEQLTLDLRIRPEPSLGNFAAGDNAELVAVLSAVEAGRPAPQFIYIWGDTGVGCTHLLHAVDPEAGLERVPSFSPSRRVYTVDDVEELSDEDLQRLFDLMNDIRSSGAGFTLVTAGDRAPSLMKGRPDVISRLSWGLVFQVRALTDEQKDAALEKLAREIRVELPADAREWLIEHLPRDMGTLTEALFEAERFAVKSSRKLTRALLRQCFLPKKSEGAGLAPNPQKASEAPVNEQK